MGQAGRRYLKSHFTPDLIAKQYSKLLVEAVLDGVEPSCSETVEQVPQPRNEVKFTGK
jgi:hypothetical protein